MLIIPFDQRLDWRHPPIVTLTLLLANILIFVFFQLDDDKQTEAAAKYYVSSGLAALEVPKYRRYAASWSNDRDLIDDEELTDDWPGWMWPVQTDVGFQKRLQNGQIISRASAEYPEWQQKRREFEKRYEQITYVGYGLRTAKASIETLFSHMFLHAGVWHLLGNGLFLVAVGFLVEAALSRSVFLFCYLLSGLGSAGFNFLFDAPALIPGIGASGAIAGLMGMYTVLYGLRRIRFFYSIGIYFDYVRLPAIVLLPAWIGNELLQIWLYPDSNINYMAHLGGLVTGAVLGFSIKHIFNSASMERLETADADAAFEQSLATARQHCDNFEYPKALPILRRLFQQQPTHPIMLNLYHEAARIDPSSDDYHKIANQQIQLNVAHVGNPTSVLTLYREYRRLAQPGPRFKSKALMQVLPALLREGELAEAEQIVHTLAKQSRRDPKLAPLAQQLASAFQAAGESQKSDRLQRLVRAWDGSPS